MINENQVLNTRYRLEKKVGQGGFAQVFLATDLLLQRTVAIKVLNAELVEDPNFLERFGAEARAVAALDHPNILAIYDYGQAEDTAYLVMPYIEGGTLSEKLRREKRFSPAQANQYLRQMASALDYAHKRNVVHRDIKPQNMLLRSEDNRLLLSDFGLAKVLSSASAQSMTGAMGTLSYMAPEQLSGNVSIGTDIYALGCVLFFMLTGSLPYGGPTEQVVMGHLSGPIPSIIERSQGQFGPAVQEVIDRALAKRPEMRYTSAGELAQAFEAALNNAEETRAIPPVPSVSVSPYEQTQVARTPAQPQNWSPTKPYSPDAAPAPTPSQPYQPPQTPSQPYVYGATPSPAYPPNNYTPPQPYSGPPGNIVASPPTPVEPARSGLNRGLLILIGALIVGVVVLGVVLVVLLSGSKGNPTPTTGAVANITGAAASQTTAAITNAPTTAATSQVATTAAATSAAPVTTVAPTTVASVTTAPATTSVAPQTTTAAPTSVAPPPPPPTKPANPNGPAIQNLLGGLPGNHSAFVILPDGQTIDSNGGTPVPSASTIKLWVSATVLEQAKNGKLNLAEVYQIQQKDVAPGTGVIKDRVGAKLTFAELINTMLVYSDNGIANILIGRVGGPGSVNNYASANGYGCTKLQRRLGYPNEGPENLTCARDAATFMQRLVQHKIVDFNSSELILQALQNRLNYPQDQNFFGPNLPPGTTYRHISGTGTGVRNEVGFLATNSGDIYNQPVIVAIYTSGLPDEGGAEKNIAGTIGQIYSLGKS